MFRMLAVAPALAAALLATPGAAQNLPCAPREQVLTFIIDQRGELRLGTGQVQNGATVDLFVAESGSWSLIVHLPNGRSCLLANGEGFEATRGLQPARGLPA